jgi:hypothetical protein
MEFPVINSMDESYHYFRHLFNGKFNEFTQKASISNLAPTKNRAKEYEFMVWIIIFGMNSYTRV